MTRTAGGNFSSRNRAEDCEWPGESIIGASIHLGEAAPAFGQGCPDILAMEGLIAPARQAFALSGFAETGTSTLAATTDVYAGILDLLRRVFAIRFHDHYFFIVHGPVPACLPGFTGRSPELTHQPKMHYTVFFSRQAQHPRPGTCNQCTRGNCRHRNFRLGLFEAVCEPGAAAR
jgi:hypothetical protein